jgi:hypothetical protein
MSIMCLVTAGGADIVFDVCAPACRFRGAHTSRQDAS